MIDVFIFWQGETSLFQEFVASLNNKSIGMKFTSEINKTKINFLDLTITLGTNGTIQMEVFRKTMSSNNFLHW